MHNGGGNKAGVWLLGTGDIWSYEVGIEQNF